MRPRWSARRAAGLLAVLVGAGIAVGGGVAAWAGPAGPERSSERETGPNREAAKACLADARVADPDADKAALREAVKACLEAQGITPGAGRTLTPEQQAAREALRACLQGVRAANPDADRAALREQARACFDAAGVDPSRSRPRLAELKQCREQVLAEHQGADRAELRRLVLECVRAS